MGKVTHYFDHVGAAIIQVETGEIRLGDRLHITGSTTDLHQLVSRIELDHEPVPVARAGQVVGIGVSDRVREHDLVSKE